MKKKTRVRDYLQFCLGILRYKPMLTLANVAGNVVIFSYAAALAYAVRQIFNSLEQGMQGGILYEIVPYILLMIGASLLRMMAIMGCGIMDSMRSFYYQNAVRVNIMRRLYKQDHMTNVTGNAGRIFELIDDDVPSCLFPPELLTEVTGYTAFTMIALGMLLSINWQITVLIFLPLSAAIYGVQKLSERMKERRIANREAHDDVSGLIGDVADCVLAIQTAGAQEAVLDHLQEKNSRRSETIRRDVLFNAKIEALLRISVSVGTVVMMFIAATMLSGGSFRLGDFSIFVVYLGSLANCVDRIVELVFEARKAEVSYERILQTIGEENAASLLEDAALTIKKKQIFSGLPKRRMPLKCFEVKQLSFSYNGEDGFRDVNFRILPGQLVAVIGGVGSGKSTLLSALSGTIKADCGDMLWNDQLIESPSALCVPPNVAYTPQKTGFFSSDIRSNICMGYPATDEELTHAIWFSVLNDTVASLKDGLHSFIGSHGHMLSGGERQRLALSRMFVRDAQLSIIDDSISALDEHTQLQLRDRLLEFIRSKSRAAIIATDRKPFLHAADQIIVMKQGRVIAKGKYDELLDSCAEFAALVS